MATPTTRLLSATRSQTHRPAGYLPTLDGWRALAILGVMFCHDSVHLSAPSTPPGSTCTETWGVDVFFAISGILICSRLLTEEESQGLSLAETSTFAAPSASCLPPSSSSPLFSSASYSPPACSPRPKSSPPSSSSATTPRSFLHFQTTYPYYTSHFWSLAIEEHFYLILPTLLIVTPKKWRVPVLLARCGSSACAASRTNLRGSASTQKCASTPSSSPPPSPSHCVLLSPQIPQSRYPPSTPILAPKNRNSPLHPNHLLPLSQNCRPPHRLVHAHSHPRNHAQPPKLVQPVPRNSCTALHRPPLLQPLPLAAALPHRPLRSRHRPPRTLQTWPLNWLMVFACALFSYYLVERPMIRLGHRLAPNVVPNRIGTQISQ